MFKKITLIAIAGILVGSSAFAAYPMMKVAIPSSAEEQGEEDCAKLAFDFGFSNANVLMSLAKSCNNASGSTCRATLKRTGGDLSPFKSIMTCPKN